MTTAGQVTWRNTPSRSLAPARLAVAYPTVARPAYRRGFVTVQFSSAADWPGCVVNATPNRLFEENMRQLAHDRAVSAIYDSRLEKICHDYRIDSAPRREALREGRSVAFAKVVNGNQVVIHRIRPEEID